MPTGTDLATATLPGFNDGGAGGLKTCDVREPGHADRRHALRLHLPARSANRVTGIYAYTCSCATTGFSNTNPYASGQFVTSGDQRLDLGGGHDGRRT